MALIKEIEEENGIITNYHRILSIKSVINEYTIIEIASYISKDIRKKELDGIKSNNPTNIYIKSTELLLDYNKNLNVENAYNYLKTLDEFKNSIDG